MDNRIFNVNGKGIEALKATLNLLLNFNGTSKVRGWRIHPEKGFILYWVNNKPNITPFPAEMSFELLAPIIMNWLLTDEAKNMKYDSWDEYGDHDGSNSYGFRVYVDAWGQVATKESDAPYTICAIRPAYLWYSK